MSENAYKNNKMEINRLRAEFCAKSCNEGLARSIVSAMAVQIDPTLDELSDIITAVSEAVTNSIIHGYGKSRKPREQCLIEMECLLYRDAIEVVITDQGCGIEDIKKAREPLYTSSPEMERSGMGFTIMESFTDHFSVESEVGKGTVIKLYKIFQSVGAVGDGGDNLCENMTTQP
jgi:anti-sigma F factor